MRLPGAIAVAALAGFAAAGQQEPAEVYLLRSNPQKATESSPRIPREIARHVLLQRTSRSSYAIALGDIPATTDAETAISYINNFGKGQQPLFGENGVSAGPAQLVILLEGVTADNARPLKSALAKTSWSQPSFLVSDPPSSRATDRLVRDFRVAGASSLPGCTLEAAVNPNDKACWDGLSAVVSVDARKTPESIDALSSNIQRLAKFVSNGEVEAALVLIPESSRDSRISSWAPRAPSPLAELRHRNADSETVLSDELPEPAATDASKAPGPNVAGEAHIWAPNTRQTIPQCFQSQNSCETRTNNCSGGHGRCINRYASDAKSDTVCFACHCDRLPVPDRPGRTVQWAGTMCQKKDVSEPFWLIAGFTVTIVGVLSFTIGLLFGVGQEKLPGVIGAGVSRSK
ncbi:hypothetical protein VTK73DRAFT_4205 [Phialemonium thermophilum]|uniref:Vacuolar sorting protein Vps3844 C-terminal domain-containing protein n=1 Tax=Phialemonium thermophilum TaxID=223376 RepID=A0ABR3WV01_9PEZI